MVDAFSGALLGVLMGCLMVLLGEVDQAAPFVVTGGTLFAAFGLLNGLRTDTSKAASGFHSSQPGDLVTAGARANTQSPDHASPEPRRLGPASPARASAGIHT